METVTLKFEGPPEMAEKFMLHEGKVVMYSVRRTFKLRTVRFDGVVADEQGGMSMVRFNPDTEVKVSGEPQEGKPCTTNQPCCCAYILHASLVQQAVHCAMHRFRPSPCISYLQGELAEQIA